MYISNTDQEKKEMLEKIGVKKFEDLISSVPKEFLNPKINLPAALSEIEISKKMRELSEKNKRLKSFVGAGVYDRYTPAAMKAILSRGEFLTAYTPYQPEASQGLLQTIYEYQSSMCALYDMDCSNASMYDGSTSFAEAVKACLRISGKNKILYSAAINPRYIETAKTYLANDPKYIFEEIPLSGGLTDEKYLAEKIDDSTACFAAANPNYFGLIENIEILNKTAKSKNILTICCADPFSLGALKTPGECGFDFAVGEGQSLGLPMSYGGPYLGIFTCRKEHIRQMPGRICGMTKDKDGKRGFVLTLQAREQHIRRDKAASNICSNQALCALGATIYCALLGPKGLKEACMINNSLAVKAAKELTSIKDVKLKYKAPFFNEFVLELPMKASELRKKVSERFSIDPGLDLSHMGKDFENSLMVCLTETKNESDIFELKKSIEACL
ncbi:MAG: aminomethyl-transferring glycine dehydrogenase subunit GcvPA [Elusimicrobiota bacterium]